MHSLLGIQDSYTFSQPDCKHPSSLDLEGYHVLWETVALAALFSHPSVSSAHSVPLWTESANTFPALVLPGLWGLPVLPPALCSILSILCTAGTGWGTWLVSPLPTTGNTLRAKQSPFASHGAHACGSTPFLLWELLLNWVSHRTFLSFGGNLGGIPTGLSFGSLKTWVWF